jgi:hypothetical protein
MDMKGTIWIYLAVIIGDCIYKGFDPHYTFDIWLGMAVMHAYLYTINKKPLESEETRG